MPITKKPKRGFAAMSKDRHREISRMGNAAQPVEAKRKGAQNQPYEAKVRGGKNSHGGGKRAI